MWIAAALLAFVSNSFGVLLFSRALIGVGESSFAGLAPTTIDDNAPPATKAKWLSVFYAAIPVGAALGYMASGQLTEASSWSVVFFVEAVFMIPFALAVWFIPPPYKKDDQADDYSEAALTFATTARQPLLSRKTTRQRSVARAATASAQRSLFTTGGSGASVYPLGEAVWTLLTNRLWVLTSLGYACQTAVVGGFSVWVPKYLQVKFDLGLGEATFNFGLLTVVCGFLGTLGGGVLLDRSLPSRPTPLQRFCKSVSLSATLVALATPVAVAAFLAKSTFPFMVLLAVCELFMFASAAPINMALLSVVPESLRAMSMALNILVIHALGDFPSPVLIGFVSDRTGSLSLALLFACVWLLACAGLWFLSAMRGRQSIEREVRVPLLQDVFQSIF